MIREWFDRQLITEQGIRGQVLMEPERSRGLSNNAIRMFEDAHLVRADERRGATWFELAHDRLIEPIRASNALWFSEHLSPLQQQADLWNRQERPDGLLLRGKQLQEAQQWAREHAAELTPTEKDFLAESAQAQAQLDKEQKQNRRIRWLAIAASIVGVIALLGILVSLLSLYQLGESLGETEQARALAEAKEQEANTQKQQAIVQDRVSKMTAGALSQLEVDPEVSLLLALEAYSTTKSVQTDDILRQAVVESRVRGTLRGHSGSVDTVAISPEGKMFATGAIDNTIKLWDASNGKELRTLKGHTAPVWSLAFNPDGTKLASGSEDGTARLWDLANCAAECPVIELRGHTGTVWSVVFAPNDEFVATGSDDKTIRFWNVADGSDAGLLEGHTGTVNAVVFSPDGTALLSASSDQTARLWDLTQCQDVTCPFQEIAGQAVFWSAAFAPDSNSFVLGSDDQTAYQYDRDPLSVTNYLSGHNDAVFSVTYSPDGKYIATGSRDGTARVWDASTGQLVAPLRGHESTVWYVTFSPDSRLLLSGSEDGTAKLWSVGNGRELRVLRGHNNKVLGADYSGDGKRVITVSQDRTARVWDAGTASLVVPPLEGHANWISGGALNSDGSRAATASFDGTVRLWDLTACNPDCPSTVLELESDARDVTYSPDGNSVLVSLGNGSAQIWNVATGARQMILPGHQGAVLHAFYSHDGKRVLTVGEDATVRVWNPATGKQELLIQAPTGTFQNAHFSPDDTLVVTAGNDRTARVWDIAQALVQGTATAPQKFELRGHTGPVTAATFSHDGKWIATGSADRTMRLWDVSDALANGAPPRELAVLRGHDDKIQTVELSPDDQYLLTASSDKTARETLLSIQEINTLAKQYVTRTLSCDEWATLLGEADYCPGGGVAQVTNPLPTLAPITRAALAPTLEPGVATAVVATAPPVTPQRSPTALPTQTAEPESSATPPATPAQTTSAPTAQPTLLTIPTAVPPVVTPTPALAPGVYVSKIVFVPINPGQSPASGEFHVTFLNNSGADLGFARWKVLVMEPGNTKPIGDTVGAAKSIPVGTTELVAGPYRIGLGECRNFIGMPVSEDDDGRQSPFLQPDGGQAVLDFQMCP
jgi:WD40 repeat protein